MSPPKRTSLDALFKAASPLTVPSVKGANTKKAKPNEDAKSGRGELTVPRHPGVKQHTAYLPEAVHEQLRKLAFEENRKIHSYLMEGLDLVFADRGLAAIKELT